jgi:hypothetical protein
MTISEDMQDAILKVPADSWMPAYDGDGQVKDGAWVADITGLLDLSSWPAGMRVIVRKERPHPGAQLGSPTSTGTGSPPSPPTRRRASSPNWNCGTAAGPAVRTGTPRTPGCGTFQTRRTLALGQRDHRRHHQPAGLAVRLTSPNHPCDTKGATPGPVEPRPSGATAGQPDTARARKSASAEPFRPARQARETSRLTCKFFAQRHCDGRI